ncbi:ribosomal L7Ae/L30e/S12e/Gadd45 family protein [Paenibacillus humicola]|uniref:ribosomal L7Ae/L30e/S12e/Gadd45 family protein n=1 Tax=Paenibacillus humicola TaxID=3110540 RepID=UPI00237A9657|nr:ribosomal L7Ae/L30e/S12e/Gadd45 family protein [Paenibacillus humicola]
MQYAVGSKQTARMVEQRKAVRVYVAQDADSQMKETIVRLCKTAGVPVQWIDTMKNLGETCGIDVGAAMAAEIPDIE